MHTLNPSTFDFTEHQTQLSSPNRPALSSYRTPANLIRDVFFPNATIKQQTDHSLEAISRKVAKKRASHSAAKQAKDSKPKIKKHSTSATVSIEKKTKKPIKKDNGKNSKKKTSKKAELLSGKGFSIRHF